MPLRPAFLFLILMMLAGCGGAYQPGTDGSRRALPQNQPANAQPQPAGSLPR